METCHGEVFPEAVSTVLMAAAGGRQGGGKQIVAVGANCCDPNHIQVGCGLTLSKVPPPLGKGLALRLDHYGYSYKC